MTIVRRIKHIPGGILKVVDANDHELSGVSAPKKIYGDIPATDYFVGYTLDPEGRYQAHLPSAVAGCIVSRVDGEPGSMVVCFLQPHLWLYKRFNRRVWGYIDDIG